MMYAMTDILGSSPLAGSRQLALGSHSSHARRHAAKPRQGPVAPRAQQRDEGLSRLFNQVRGVLPVVGLISRLTAPEGGIGSDELAYPEYSRAVFEAAPEGFQIAVAELQNRYGKPAQRRCVLMCLWMVQQGVGILPAKRIVDAARRLRVSQDLEFEMERFGGTRTEEITKYKFITDRPRGKPQEQADVAVDALVRLCIGLKDGEPLVGEDITLIEDAVVGGLLETGPQFREMVKKSIETRADRANAYV